MTDDEVLAICKAQINGALGFLNGKLAQARLKALQYYNAEPYGNEVEGSSQIVTTEVRDVVELIMPSLMKIFVSGDKVAEFEPVGPGDEAIASQATDYTNYIFTKDNKGYDVLQTAFRDGLIQKCGVVKIGWEVGEDITKDSYKGLTDLELEQLVAPNDVEVVAHDAYDGVLMQPDPQSGLPSPQPARLHDVVVRRRKKTGRVNIRAVPPEEFLISRRAVSLSAAAFIGHRVRKTATELIEMGYARKVVDGLPGNDAQDFNAERLERFSAEDEAPFVTNPALDPATKEIWLTECYLKMDHDGDGLAELRKVTVAGDPGMTILDNEEIDSLPFAYWTPVPQPHKFFGLSMADLTMDLQLTQSTVTRQVLDNMYRANNGRFAISGKVNVEDMLTPRPGGLVRMTDPNVMPEGHFMPLETASIAPLAMPLLEMLDTKQETRTGVTRYNQGLDANTLNKTATGMNLITGFAQMRQELIARNAGEMLVAGIFKKILELVCKHQQEPRMVRLRGTWVAMDPREWNDQMDVTVTVGLGNGNKDQMLGHLMMILQTQQAAMQQLGPQNPLVGLPNVYNTLEKICENAGLKTAGPYFNDPKSAPAVPPPPGAPGGYPGAGPGAGPGGGQPDPRAIYAQGSATAGVIRAQADMHRAQNEPPIRAVEAAMSAKADIVKAKIAAGATIAAAAIKAGGSLQETIHEVLSEIFRDSMDQGGDQSSAGPGPQPPPQMPPGPLPPPMQQPMPQPPGGSA